MEFSRPVLEWVAFPFSRDLPNPGIEPRSLASQADFFLPAEPQGKRKNTGVGSLSLPQRSFLTQKLNWCLLHCRQILYQLSYQGSPDPWESPVKCRFGHTQGRPSSPLLREARERGRGHIKLVSSWRKLRRMQLIFSIYLSSLSLHCSLQQGTLVILGIERGRELEDFEKFWGVYFRGRERL